MEALKIKRGRVKGALTRIFTYASSFPDNATLADINLKQSKLEQAWHDYHTIDSAMIDAAAEARIDHTDDDLVDFEESYYSIAKLLNDKIDELTPAPENHPNTSHVSLNTSSVNVKTEKQLPKIQIKPFSGDFTTWSTFRDLYESTVHNNTNLTSCQKFYYLKSFLVDEAANLLTHMSVTDDNYVQAWDKLNNRYDKKGHIANALIQKFLNLSSGTSTSGYSSLRKLADGADEILRGLKALGAEAETRDIWLIYLLVKKLDSDTQTALAESSTDSQFPTIANFLLFLEKRCDILTPRYTDKVSKPVTHGSPKVQTNNSFKSFHTTVLSCSKCNAAHELHQCSQFLTMAPHDRRTFTQTKSLCFNCLRAGHRSTSCKSTNSCRQCQRRHHTLLHTASQIPRTPATSNKQHAPKTPLSTIGTPVEASTPIQSHHLILATHNSLVVAHSVESTRSQSKTYLPTAVVNTRDCFGTTHSIRILLDSGSQCSFISEACAQRLSLTRSHAKIPVSGISSTGAGITRGSVTLTLQSRLSDKSIKLSAYVMPKLTTLLPNFVGGNTQNHTYELIKLADPDYQRPGPIDMIIGADKMFLIIENQTLHGPAGSPSAILTIFGWVIAGAITTKQGNSAACSLITSLHTTVQTDFDLTRFWELEEITSHSHLSEDEQRTESHFASTHFRASDGKYVVELPFKEGEWKFGNSLAAAISRQKAMERKFTQNATLKQRYIEFMTEYLTLGHMSPIDRSEIERPMNQCYYLPHHAVFKEDSSTTKLRVVFDGSAKHGDESSLNHALSIGSPIQRDLFCVCTRFRRHKYCFSADIKQMFRQIWVADKHRDFQRIVWRDDSNKPLTHYRLNTVTYGTTSAPFLSIRTLVQLAKDIESTDPEIADIILKDFYVDDILSGANSIEEVTILRNNLLKVLSSAGFNLRKWSTNSLQLLLTIPEDERELSPLALQDSSSIKLLGLRWCPADDSFSYNIALPEPVPWTKRNMLSEAARVFDPLGFLAPAIVLIKILFQELWCRKLDWDDSLPDDLATQWRQLRSEIANFTQLKIPRRIWCSENDVEFHGFCDASQKAYAAVIYCRSRDEFYRVQTVLVTAKTKAAPLKQISLPRLELCAAVLLSRLFHKLFLSFQMKHLSFHAWTDSQLVLHWLSSPPRRWSTFIANRTAEVISVAPRSKWSHVKSSHNPADCASRGLLPSHLIHHNLWWYGPDWLPNERAEWPTEMVNVPIDTTLLEERKAALDVLSHHTVVSDDHILIKLLLTSSSWTKLYRTIAYCFRFSCKLKREISRNYNVPSLTTIEINKAKVFCLQYAQQSAFRKEINCLANGQELPANSPLLPLTPFLDSDKLLRVGGRISHSTLSYAAKHPIILPKRNTITHLIIQHTHHQHLHVGASGLFAILRHQYWIFGCRNLIRKLVHNCIICVKQRKATITQLMGELPAERVRFTRPFNRVGIDYAGPFTLRAVRGRNPKYGKGYICLFVCFTTKAIHLELATDLSTDTFLAALDRFCARRGKPSEIFSDNGTNFQGAHRKLDEMHQILLSDKRNSIIMDHLTKDNISWNFIPPASPHFGGLWEAGVKSVKNHLSRVVGTHVLTYEEMYTLLARVESILNSRPLMAVSDSDVNVLTPAHFLIGEPYTSIPEPDVETYPTSLHNKWLLLRHLSQGFWKRWHHEYITSMQQRPKWQRAKRNVEIGDVVLLYESHLPAAKWILGKVTNTIAGSDGYVRVATVKTDKGIYDRPITKLAILPLAESDLSGSPGMFRNGSS